MHCLLHLFMSGLCGVQEGRHHRHQSSDSMQRSSILAPRCWSAPSINTVTSLHLYLRNAVSNSVGTKTWCCQCGQWQTLVCIWAWASSAWQLIHGCTYITRSWHILNTYMSTYILNASTIMNSKVSSACLHPCLVFIWRLFCNIGSQHWTSLMSVLCFFFFPPTMTTSSCRGLPGWFPGKIAVVYMRLYSLNGSRCFHFITTRTFIMLAYTDSILLSKTSSWYYKPHSRILPLI